MNPTVRMAPAVVASLNLKRLDVRTTSEINAGSDSRGVSRGKVAELRARELDTFKSLSMPSLSSEIATIR
ncbi:hypothetical protein [Frondihabitans sp. PhB188]|uniref:hypothetical protein n=1 Tax=Frondihabitans sp. PhB188 TaxID=2485200 RepID=UPI0011CDCE56|nr:hypothetical protein [Frondihabitans sp. PhB188]